jgi:hypothetical protein
MQSRSASPGRRWFAFALLTAAVPAAVAAQSQAPAPVPERPVREVAVRLAGSASSMTLYGLQGAGPTPVALFAGALDGRLDFGWMALGAGYAEAGRSAHEPGMPISFVEGWLRATARVGRLVELDAGPLVRATAVGAQEERWVHWRWGGRIEDDILGPRVRAFAEGWGALSHFSGAAGRQARAQGGVAGVRWNAQTYRVSLEYAIDEVRLERSAQRTVERVTVRFEIVR